MSDAIPTTLILVVATGLISGLAVIGQHTGSSTRIVGGTSVVIALLTLEILSGEISSAIGSTIVMVGSGLGEVAAPIALLAASVAAYGAVRIIQARREAAGTPETEVRFDLGGRDD